MSGGRLRREQNFSLLIGKDTQQAQHFHKWRMNGWEKLMIKWFCGLVTDWLHYSCRVREHFKIHFEIYIIQLLHPHCSRTPTSVCVANERLRRQRASAYANERLRRQQASASPTAKLEVSSICNADRAASPASPISSLVYWSRYPRAFSSLVISTWVTERWTRSVEVMHLIYESCQL